MATHGRLSLDLNDQEIKRLTSDKIRYKNMLSSIPLRDIISSKKEPVIDIINGIKISRRQNVDLGDIDLGIDLKPDKGSKTGISLKTKVN